MNRLFGIAAEDAGKKTLEFLKTLGKQDMLERIPENSRRVRSYSDFFVNILWFCDTVTIIVHIHGWIMD